MAKINITGSTFFSNKTGVYSARSDDDITIENSNFSHNDQAVVLAAEMVPLNNLIEQIRRELATNPALALHSNVVAAQLANIQGTASSHGSSKRSLKAMFKIMRDELIKESGTITIRSILLLIEKAPALIEGIHHLAS